jgi:hypothetical protein
LKSLAAWRLQFYAASFIRRKSSYVSLKSCNRILHRKKSSVKSAGVGYQSNGMFFAADEIARFKA